MAWTLGERGEVVDGALLGGTGAERRARRASCMGSMSGRRERISLTSTLKDSGMPATGTFSPLTMDS